MMSLIALTRQLMRALGNLQALLSQYKLSGIKCKFSLNSETCIY